MDTTTFFLAVVLFAASVAVLAQYYLLLLCFLKELTHCKTFVSYLPNFEKARLAVLTGS